MVRSTGGLQTSVDRFLQEAGSDHIGPFGADMCKMRILVQVTSLASIAWLTRAESSTAGALSGALPALPGLAGRPRHLNCRWIGQ